MYFRETQNKQKPDWWNGFFWNRCKNLETEPFCNSLNTGSKYHMKVADQDAVQVLSSWLRPFYNKVMIYSTNCRQKYNLPFP